MKRIQLFEFEDQSWFPHFFRQAITRLLKVVHRMLGTEHKVAKLLLKIHRQHPFSNILDLCSGSGGPMPGVLNLVRTQTQDPNLKLTLSDLYPDLNAAEEYNNSDDDIEYKTEPMDAASAQSGTNTLHTMICSFHHMPRDNARKILKNAIQNRQPLFIFELSDNSSPKWLWWTAFPVNIIASLFITLKVRPLPLYQILFTYLIPVIPLCYAWDGAVSNARTYTLEDIDILLEGLHDDRFEWTKGTLPGRMPSLFLYGLPKR